MEKIIYYKDEKDDVVGAKDQEYKLKDDYKWIRKDPISVVLSFVIYTLALVFSFFYLHFHLKMRIKGKKKLKGLKEGCFIYANHTQPIGDVFIPAHAAFSKRIYTIVSPANYSIPFIGKILPYLGALPIKEGLKGIKGLNDAINERIKERKAIVVYPEAHVWPYYTKIRSFSQTSFKYPVKLNVPSFSLTATYTKPIIGKRPRMVVYIDGPYLDSDALNLKETIYNKMVERSKSSDIEYIRYIRH